MFEPQAAKNASYKVFFDVWIVLSIVITLGILILNWFPVAKAPMIFVINAHDLDAEEEILNAIRKYEKYFTVKSRNMTGSSFDLVIELRTAKGSELVLETMKLAQMTSASLLSHDGEVTF